MKRTMVALAALTAFGFAPFATAQTEMDTKPEMIVPGSEAPPGYEDFKEAGPDAKEIEEADERRYDRNVVSPGMRDEHELDREMGVD